MTTSAVVWTEGMYIAPQHFQQFDVHIRKYVNDVIQLNLTHGDYGFSKLVFNDELERIGKIGLKSASGVFPDRLYFNLEKELVLDIPDGTTDEIVYLGVPLAVRGSEQFGSAEQSKRFVTKKVQLPDLNDNENEQIEAVVAEVGAELLFGGRDLSGFTLIPLARILEKTADGKVVLDSKFIPVVLRSSASQSLSSGLEQIISLLRFRCTNASERILSQKNSRSGAGQLVEILELQTLSKWLTILNNMAAPAFASARQVHEYLSCATAELDAMEGVFNAEQIAFDQNNLTSCFEIIFAKLRKNLTLEKPVNVIELNWNFELFETRRVLRIIIPPNVLEANRKPVLAIKSDSGASQLLETIPLACKMCGLSEITELISKGLQGVDLQPLTTPPSELRASSETAFFNLDTSNNYWKKFIKKREALALHIDNRIELSAAKLYLIG